MPTKKTSASSASSSPRNTPIQWIPMTKRSPKLSEGWKFLVTRLSPIDVYVEILYYGKIWDYDDDGKKKRITTFYYWDPDYGNVSVPSAEILAWMPIPAPYPATDLDPVPADPAPTPTPTTTELK